MGAATISPTELYRRLGTALGPLLVDVRPAESAGDTLIVGAVTRAADDAERWLKDLSPGRAVVVYCSAGQEPSRRAAEALNGAGVAATYLEGGMAAWKACGLPTRRKRDAADDKWVTREHPKIDRIACPWLVRRFINPLAEFIYVPPADVLSVAKERAAIPYDIKGVEFGHVGECCSFDAIIRGYDIHDPALDHLATIVRGADTSRPDLTPQGEGLLAISYGLSSNFPDDHEMLAHGMVMYDALYTWCRLDAAKQQSARATA